MQQPGSASAAIPAALAGTLPLELGKKRAAENDMFQLVLRCYFISFNLPCDFMFSVDKVECMMGCK